MYLYKNYIYIFCYINEIVGVPYLYNDAYKVSYIDVHKICN